eukprot:1809935-Alexandrium_andersonii.AAC.1
MRVNLGLVVGARQPRARRRGSRAPFGPSDHEGRADGRLSWATPKRSSPPLDSNWGRGTIGGKGSLSQRRSRSHCQGESSSGPPGEPLPRPNF